MAQAADFIIEGKISHLQREVLALQNELKFLRRHLDEMNSMVAGLIEALKPKDVVN